MSTNTSGSTVGVTLLEVVAPPVSGAFSSTILGAAKQQHQKQAAESLVDLAKQVMLAAQARLAAESQRVKDLQSALTQATECMDKTAAAVQHADTIDSGLFALAAYLGLKSSVQAWCRSNAVVTPANDDVVWSLPEPKKD